MTILAALQSAAIRLAGQRPQTFFGSTQNLEAELCDMVNEVAQDVAKYHDWQALTRVATIAGDGVLTEFALPADYDRMVLASQVRDTGSWLYGYHAYRDLNAFLIDQDLGFKGAPGGWIIYGDTMRFVPAPASSARFPYITKDIVRSESTATKAEFTADTDSFILPERLLTLGVVWRWRENKKLDATGDQEAFVKALDEYVAKDGGGPDIIRRNSRGGFPGTHLAYPYLLGPSTYVDR